MAAIRAHAACGIRFHQAACVYPCEFSTSFIPTTATAEIGVGCAIAGPRTAAHSSFWSGAVCAVDRLQRRGIERLVELYPVGGVQRQKLAHARPVRSGEQVGAHVLGADRVGLRFLQVLALVVTADRHREAEADDEAEQRERRRQDDAEILTSRLRQATCRFAATQAPAWADSHSDDERDDKEKDRMVGEGERKHWESLLSDGTAGNTRTRGTRL